jgi:hypothetical protein
MLLHYVQDLTRCRPAPFDAVTPRVLIAIVQRHSDGYAKPELDATLVGCAREEPTLLTYRGECDVQSDTLDKPRALFIREREGGEDAQALTDRV